MDGHSYLRRFFLLLRCYAEKGYWYLSFDNDFPGHHSPPSSFSLEPYLMGSASSMLTQYDIEEVQEHCNFIFPQQEIVSLYQWFCQLDRNAKGFISADEFLSVPEFAMNPLSQRLHKMVDGLNFKDFAAFLSAFSSKASTQQKIEFIFKVYDSDSNGKVSFSDILEVLQDLPGSFISNEQREQVLTKLLKEAGYSRDSYLLLDDFIKLFANSELRKCPLSSLHSDVCCSYSSISSFLSSEQH